MTREKRNFEMNGTGKENLEWLAFCYVADELDEQQRTEFETRLEDDQVARDAVVEAMRQAELIWMAMDQSSSRPTKLTPAVAASNRQSLVRYAASLMAVTAAALLMVAVSSWFTSNDLPAAKSALTEDETLAVVLAELFDEESSIVEIEFEDADYEVAESNDSEDEFSDWMFVALTDMEDGMGGAE